MRAIELRVFLFVQGHLLLVNTQHWQDLDRKQSAEKSCRIDPAPEFDTLEECKEWCMTQTVCSCRAVTYAAHYEAKKCWISSVASSPSQLTYASNNIYSFFDDADDCDSNPCHRGTCLDRYQSYTCVCPPGYTGQLCEKPFCKTTQRGIEYNGTLATTVSGKVCQRWDSQLPHAHSFSAFDFPDGSLNHNFCRNPVNRREGPWCFTTEEYLIWEYCDVHFCAMCEEICLKEDDATGQHFSGRMSSTQNGKICQRWDQQHPHKHSYNTNLTGSENYCRNPASGSHRPWCYTTDPNWRYDHCSIPSCGQGFISMQTTGLLADDTIVLDSTTCQAPVHSSGNMKLIFYLKAPATDILFELNYRLLKGSHECGQDDSLLAFTNPNQMDIDPVTFGNGQCKQRSYDNKCTTEATAAADNGVQGCRIRCQSDEPFSEIFLLLSPTFYPYEVCGARMCPIV